MLASATPDTLSLTCAHFRGWKRQLSFVFAWLPWLCCLPS